jgi:hypothetical protein
MRTQNRDPDRFEGIIVLGHAVIMQDDIEAGIDADVSLLKTDATTSAA